MKVNFNNMRTQMGEDIKHIVNSLNEGIAEGEVSSGVATHIECEMNNLIGKIKSLFCIYDEDDPLFTDMSDNPILDQIKEFNPTLYTSEYWLDRRNSGMDEKVVIINPDGWDRSNYEFSFKEERITEEEFEMRLAKSTIEVYR